MVEDLRGLHPAVYDNLMKLRSHAGSFEDLGLVFQVRRDTVPGYCQDVQQDV